MNNGQERGPPDAIVVGWYGRLYHHHCEAISFRSNGRDGKK